MQENEFSNHMASELLPPFSKEQHPAPVCPASAIARTSGHNINMSNGLVSIRSCQISANRTLTGIVPKNDDEPTDVRPTSS